MWHDRLVLKTRRAAIFKASCRGRREHFGTPDRTSLASAGQRAATKYCSENLANEIVPRQICLT